jgi:DNA-binding response OmpR family regulator
LPWLAGIQATAESAPLARPKVLFVEDDGLIAMDLEVVVQEAGFDVLGPYATTASALALLAVRRPDAALLDIGLPDGPASPLAEALAAAGVPFALVTGYEREDLSEAALAKAPTLQKPFTAAVIKGVLAALLDGGSL